MKITQNQVDEILGDHGPLAENNPNFKARPEQQEMARAINKAIQNSDNLLVEAGTGVGKTFAYLVPAVLSERQIVVSTGTKNLQDQLFKRDLPAVLKMLGKSPLIAQLKGRNNYLCEYRLENTLAAGRLPDPKAVKHLNLVNNWREKTLTGDLAELSPLPEDSAVIPFVTSTTDNCLGQDCPFIEKCFLAAARERARKAKILVVNHHLLLADLVLKEDGFGELLPDTDVFVVDEAHHLVKTAYQFYGDSVSSRQITELCRELELEYRTQVTDCRDLMLDAQRLAKEVKEFRLALPEYDVKEDWKPDSKLLDATQELYHKVNRLFDVVKVNSNRTKVLESCFERIVSIKNALTYFLGTQMSSSGNEDRLLGRINWYETMKSGFRLHSTPIDVDNLFQNSRSRYANSSWIMTSATLSVNKSFDHYIEALGWGDIATLELASCFDYPEQSLFYVPRYLPAAGNRNRSAELIERLYPMIEKAGGRTFVLFTSHRALKEGAEKLKQLEGFNLLVQGEASKQALLDKFLRTKNSVLLATGSFWEGVDVSGDDLILVIIDKLPFAPPDDPVLNAKIRRARKNGENPFMSLQIPDAVLSLKQGVGRLIRSVKDRGVVCVCDPRLVTRHYGEIFINSLPEMRRTRDEQLVAEFLADIIAPIDVSKNIPQEEKA
ncbi:ATP-dependent DNA helicase [Aliikangiella sp. G2MR2-5]|uniref:ATP-dependent DNA helicase n=1 Tax=Aliikangiella sp. G2MR2-5 TaxID=2788943 RepID=UPI0018A9D6B3|nr:ATP-dependent DNA helicase [Aliikangiella sp. G2MR2-5]